LNIKLLSLLILVLLIGNNFELISGENFLFDDFQESRKHWKWEAVGNAVPAFTKNGILYIDLQNPLEGVECNTAIWNGYNSYRYAVAKIRLRALMPMQVGSRGWGFWHTSSFPLDILQLAWFMEQKDPTNSPILTWWQAIKAKNTDPSTWGVRNMAQYSNQRWQTYKIIWEPGSVKMFVDSVEVFYSNQDVPDTEMAFHLWVDNQVYGFFQNPVPYGWSGTNALAVDYVEIREWPEDTPPSYSSGKIIYRDSTFQVADGYQDKFRKYEFQSDVDRHYFLITGSAESNDTVGDADHLAIKIDDVFYGWNSKHSLNGNQLKGRMRTLFIDTVLAYASHSLELLSQSSAVVNDVTILRGDSLVISMVDSVESFAPGGQEVPWKSYNFFSPAGEVYVYLAARAWEDTLFAWDNPVSSDERDDDLRIVLDTTDYGWNTAQAIDGNKLRGNGRALLLRSWVQSGEHNLTIWSDNRPWLSSVYIFTPTVVTGLLPSGATIDRRISVNVFPNPFNREVKISVYKYQQGRLIIKIFDIEGRLVRSFMNSNTNAGNSELRWDGTDNVGAEVASGVYLVRVTAGEAQQNRKIILLK
jgi:hypothetical protein